MRKLLLSSDVDEDDILYLIGVLPVIEFYYRATMSFNSLDEHFVYIPTDLNKLRESSMLLYDAEISTLLCTGDWSLNLFE
jgi:hypothetical protein